MSSTEYWKWVFDPENWPTYTVADDNKGLTQARVDRVHKYAFLTRIVVFEPLGACRKCG
jgi:hypothetical protein